MDRFLKAPQWREEKSKHHTVIYKYNDGEAVYKQECHVRFVKSSFHSTWFWLYHMEFLAGRCRSTGNSPEESNSNELGLENKIWKQRLKKLSLFIQTSEKFQRMQVVCWSSQSLCEKIRSELLCRSVVYRFTATSLHVISSKPFSIYFICVRFPTKIPLRYSIDENKSAQIVSDFVCDWLKFYNLLISPLWWN